MKRNIINDFGLLKDSKFGLKTSNFNVLMKIMEGSRLKAKMAYL